MQLDAAPRVNCSCRLRSCFEVREAPGFRSNDALYRPISAEAGIQLGPTLFASAIFCEPLGVPLEGGAGSAGWQRAADHLQHALHAEDASSKRGDWRVGLRRQMLAALSARAGTPFEIGQGLVQVEHRHVWVDMT